MPIKNPVINSPLFTAVAPYISSINPIVLAYEFMLTHEEGNNRVDFDARDINSAFTWISSVQGMDFWSNLHAEYLKNVRAENIVSDITYLYKGD